MHLYLLGHENISRADTDADSDGVHFAVVLTVKYAS